jgi:hypothetical protein
MKTSVQIFISTHTISDLLIKEYCSKHLYLIASGEVARCIDKLNVEISNLLQLEQLLLEEFSKGVEDEKV